MMKSKGKNIVQPAVDKVGTQKWIQIQKPPQSQPIGANKKYGEDILESSKAKDQEVSIENPSKVANQLDSVADLVENVIIPIFDSEELNLERPKLTEDQNASLSLPPQHNNSNEDNSVNIAELHNQNRNPSHAKLEFLNPSTKKLMGPLRDDQALIYHNQEDDCEDERIFTDYGGTELVEPLIGVRVRNENSFFWFDGWSEESFPPSDDTPITDLKLKQVWNNGRWDVDVIRNPCPWFNFSWLHHKYLLLSDGIDDYVWKAATSVRRAKGHLLGSLCAHLYQLELNGRHQNEQGNMYVAPEETGRQPKLMDSSRACLQ
ncbi:hypothetical protein ACH5RR_007598 [Cinchona calisaya]|uniref:Uncharacterized protein n=1 Tax=Cinchona calisaya TaxID=153742 RepID=A0ABD3A952_9GENT